MIMSKNQQEFPRWVMQQMNNRERCMVLTGYAGTGKTTTMRHLGMSMPESEEESLMWCCPTHEAKNILQGKIGQESNVLTIASALGMGNAFVNGEMKFVPGVWKNKINEASPQLLVVDEASMVSKEQLDLLLDTTATHILFVGDPAQLPPVHEPYSQVFRMDWPTYELTEIFRQGKDSPIIEAAYDCRDSGEDSTKEWGIETLIVNQDTILDFFARFPEGVALCPTKDQKYWINRVVRGGDMDVKKGDMLFLESPVCPPNGPTNGERVRVVSDPERTTYRGINVFRFKINTGHEMMMPVDDHEGKVLIAKLSELATLYKRKPDEKIKREVELLNYGITFASFGAAMTVHKSQGSTFGEVLLCTQGLSNWKDKEKSHLKLIYTGMTRASHTLIIGRSERPAAT